MARTINEAALLGATVVASSLANFNKRIDNANPKALKDYISKVESLAGTQLGSTTFTPGLIDSMKKMEKYLEETKGTSTVMSGTIKELYEHHAQAHQLEQKAAAAVDGFNADVDKTETKADALF